MCHPHHIDAMSNRWQRAQAGRHGREGESSARAMRAREVQGTLTGMIAGKKQRLALLIPAGEGEAADQMIDDCEAPPHPGVGEHFVVGSCLREPKLAHQLVVVVESQVGDKVREDR
jgi:hypothetical protein